MAGCAPAEAYFCPFSFCLTTVSWGLVIETSRRVIFKNYFFWQHQSVWPCWNDQHSTIASNSMSDWDIQAYQRLLRKNSSNWLWTIPRSRYTNNLCNILSSYNHRSTIPINKRLRYLSGWRLCILYWVRLLIDSWNVPTATLLTTSMRGSRGLLLCNGHMNELLLSLIIWNSH
jgi:hypothetical protein